jgi:hypothetical protein
METRERPLIQHLRKYLGDSDAGWIEDSLGIQVWRFKDKPVVGAATYTTVGLSNHLLGQHEKAAIRQELVFSCYEHFSDLPIQKRLLSIASDVMGSHDALSEGQVLGPHGPLFYGVKTESLLALQPSFFPDGFGEFTETDGSTVIMVWLVPLHHDEAAFARRHGWNIFESLVVELNPDVMDLNRPVMNLALP